MAVLTNAVADMQTNDAANSLAMELRAANLSPDRLMHDGEIELKRVCVRIGMKP